MIWMSVTTLLPIIIAEEPWSRQLVLFCIHRFFLIYAICILFDYRDRADDKAAGVRSLITYLDERGILLLFVFSLCVFAASAIALSGYLPAWIIGVLLLPGIITGLLYNYARKNFSDLFYYGILDGLMALSSLITLIALV